MLKSIITNPDIKIVKGIHPEFRARHTYGFQRDTYTYHYCRSTVRLSKFKKERVRYIPEKNISELYAEDEYYLFCLEGTLFSGTKTFTSKKEAEAWLEPKLLQYEDNRMGR